MKEALIVLMDKGHFKAYTLQKSNKQKKRINLITSFDNSEAMLKMSDKISDQAGRFRQGNCENHHLKQEEEKRFLKKMAKDINTLVKEHNYPTWFFASEKSINNKVLNLIDNDAKCCLKEHIAADLIYTDKMELINRFNF